VVIIGGGYAGLSCAQRVRELDPNVQITVLNREPFCSRPNLFFRFKFPQWHERHFDYNCGIITDDLESEKSFPKKHNIHFLNDCTVLKVHLDQNMLTVQNKVTQETSQVLYDRLCLATGGQPNLVPFTIEHNGADGNLLLPESAQSVSFVNDAIQYDKYVQNVENMFAVRNVEEIRLLYRAIRHLHDAPDTGVSKNIVIVGSGALSIDIVTHILEGYENIFKYKTSDKTKIENSASKIEKEVIWNMDEIDMDQLPKLTILARKSTMARPLLQDEVASKMITDMVLKKDDSTDKFQVSKYLDFVSEDAVESIIVSQQTNDDGKSACIGVRAKSGQIIPCSVVIQAVGVNSNTELASDCGLQIGSKGGIIVNENFQCLSSDNATVINNVFAAGDCVELSTKYVGGGLSDEQSVVWKNWTSAREQAVECANSMLDSTHLKSSLWFNQTLRMFGLYVACLGMYHHESTDESQSIHVFKSVNADVNRFFKLVYHRNSTGQMKLIGSLVIGPDMSDFRLGSLVLDTLRSEVLFSQDFAGHTINFTPAQWTALVKVVKSNHKEKIECLSQEQEKQILEAASEAPKKRVNPLLAKKAVRKNPLEAKKLKSTSTAATEKIEHPQ